MAEETGQEAYAMIYKKPTHVTYCFLRGAMAEPGNWSTFTPTHITDLSANLPDGKYTLLVLDGGPEFYRVFSVTLKDLDFINVKRPRRADSAQPNSVKDVIAEKARQIMARRSTGRTAGEERDHGEEQERER